ncbi:RDD family protein [Mucilaginibacter sp. 22184]|uniref:RDD family protein n=1 Tax=Mucilaginibacter sp. 22184 TaxID=3453887 RepID=UPI003F85A473
MQTIRITTTQNIDIDYEVAGLGERIVAYIIDMAMFGVIIIATFIIFAALGSGGVGREITNGIILIVYAVLYVFYDLICELAMNGQSVGKKIMKIKVISLDGARPRLGQYLLRWLFRIIDFLPGTLNLCGLICVAVSDKSQRLGDMVAGTTLIRTVPRTKMQNIAFKPEGDNYQPVFTEAAQLSEQDIELINEVINNYVKSGNSMLVYNMAQRIKDLLNVTPPAEMNNMLFLQTIIKDYSHIIAQADVL